jgi:hypothetical protein
LIAKAWVLLPVFFLFAAVVRALFCWVGLLCCWRLVFGLFAAVLLFCCSVVLVFVAVCGWEV